MINIGKNKTVPKRYIPNNLTEEDKIKQRKGILKAQREYKDGRYVIRETLKSFKSKPSPHIVKAQKLYGVEMIKPSRLLEKKTKCNIKGLRKIFKKGQGAYYSSGSRPNQTPHSWAYARLASSISGGKAAGVDFKILKEHCKPNSKAIQLAHKSMKKYNKGRKKVPQTLLSSSSSKEKKTRKNSAKNFSKKRKWSDKYKKSINCKAPKGFSQKQHCLAKKNKNSTRKQKNKN